MSREQVQGQPAASVEALTRLRDLARRHPTRLATLALLANKRHGTTLSALRTELPQPPFIALVGYHVRVLCHLGLIRRDHDIEGVVYALA